MKKQVKKLTLAKETVLQLDPLVGVIAGAYTPLCPQNTVDGCAGTRVCQPTPVC